MLEKPRDFFFFIGLHFSFSPQSGGVYCSSYEDLQRGKKGAPATVACVGSQDIDLAGLLLNNMTKPCFKNNEISVVNRSINVSSTCKSTNSSSIRS